MVQFGMAIDVSDEEETKIRPIFEAAEAALVLTNDYWSWDREWQHAQRTNNARIVNAVHLFVRTQTISIDQAREVVREKIFFYEAEYVRIRDNFYAQNPEIPSYLKQYIEVCGSIVAGNHYWCANCPRHHAWREQEAARSDASFPSTSVGTMSDISDMSTSSPESPRMLVATGSSPVESLDLQPEEGFLWMQKPSDRALMAPHDYISSMPSKGIRPLLIEAINQWLLVGDRSLGNIKKIIDLLHNSSLILDDIEDNSALRRGLPSTHIVFGQAQSINSANFMFVQAVQIATQLKNPNCIAILLEELECLFLGQSWDLYWKHHLQIPTEDQYLEMVDNKTGAMFRLLARLMMCEGATPRSGRSISSFSRLSQVLGRFFQIRDDYMNLNSTEYMEQKGFCEDLDEGKMSYPILLLLRQCPQYQNHIMGLFRQQAELVAKAGVNGMTGLDQETKLYIVQLLRDTGVLSSTLTKLKELEATTNDAIGQIEAELGETNPILRVLVSRLSVQDISP